MRRRRAVRSRRVPRKARRSRVRRWWRRNNQLSAGREYIGVMPLSPTALHNDRSLQSILYLLEAPQFGRTPTATTSKTSTPRPASPRTRTTLTRKQSGTSWRYLVGRDLCRLWWQGGGVWLLRRSGPMIRGWGEKSKCGRVVV